MAQAACQVCQRQRLLIAPQAARRCVRHSLMVEVKSTLLHPGVHVAVCLMPIGYEVVYDNTEHENENERVSRAFF